ncbi:GNAT family N-acetyltransferase [Oscillospiraceae bacterium OttesenSCG-928-G22]|nr:GNAT family N-acetyltransferase [Oscillospiraceae bacterium OttesenSCG-928-G22]
MREILRLDESHIDAYTTIAHNAYPSFKDRSEEGIRAYKARVADILRTEKDVEFFGLFDGGKLITVMRLFRFQMNCFGRIIPASGLGFLGVDLLHKKQNAARPMVQFYEEWSLRQDIPLALLLPFRPDYYKKMGYGIGTKMNQYRIETRYVPAYFGEADLRFVGRDELDGLFACYDRYVARTHGMLRKIGDERYSLATDDYAKIVASYGADGAMDGYVVFHFQNGKAGNYTINHIYVDELVYESPVALGKLLGFLRKQEDQAQLTIFNTPDDSFHYLFDNPLNDSMNYVPFGNIESNTQGVGIMYKALDAKRLFEMCGHRSYNGADLAVRFRIFDEKRESELECVTVSIEGGKAEVSDCAPEVTVSLSQSDFSALFLGCVSVRALYRLARLGLDDASKLDALDLAMHVPEKPVNNTDF